MNPENKKEYKIIKIIITIILTIIVATTLTTVVIGVVMRATAILDFAMIPKLILPICIVAIPTYPLIYKYLYGKKIEKDD